MSTLIGRRDLLKMASAAVAALAAAPGTFAMPAEITESVGKATNWKPFLFDKRQNEAVIALTEAIIPQTDTPGAKQAKVNRYIDLFLSVKPASEQKEFLNGLASLGPDFASRGAAEQTALLTRLAEANDPFFVLAKKMTSSIYYATPEGRKELNKFGTPETYYAV